MKAIHMNLTLRCLFIILIVTSACSQPRWRLLPNSPTAASAGRHDDVFFINPNVGWVVNGQRQIWKTTNAGATWQLKFSAAGYLRCVGFADSLTGWAGSLDSNSVLYRTSDGGNSWSLVTNFFPTPPKGVCGIWVVNKNVAYGSGSYFGSPRVIKTTNSGASWTTFDLSNIASALVDCYFFNQDSGFVVGARGRSALGFDSAAIFFTSNGGATWATRYAGRRSGELCWKISFPSATLGFVSIEAFGGTTRFHLRTTDRGATWEERPFVNNYDAQGIGFVNQQLGWIGGWSGTTQGTTDGGTNWHQAAFGTNVNRIRFLSDTLGYAVGSRVYRYSRDSTTSIEDYRETTPGVFSLKQNYPNPFNPSTTIRFEVGNSGFASIRVFNPLGELVATLVNNEMRAGKYETLFDGGGLPSGVYFYQMEVVAKDGKPLRRWSQTRKLVLIR